MGISPRRYTEIGLLGFIGLNLHRHTGDGVHGVKLHLEEAAQVEFESKV
jgi:hypothetical protein